MIDRVVLKMGYLYKLRTLFPRQLFLFKILREFRTFSNHIYNFSNRLKSNHMFWTIRCVTNVKASVAEANSHRSSAPTSPAYRYISIGSSLLINSKGSYKVKVRFLLSINLKQSLKISMQMS